MTIRVSLCLVAALFLTPVIPRIAHAQRPDQIAMKPQHAPNDPLQVLDDFGVPITEKDIRQYQGRSGARWFMQPFAFMLGAAALYAATPRGTSEDNCSIYDPCSDREKFFRSTSALTGGILGIVILNAAGPGLTRWQAIEKVREDRRRMHRENRP